jgi:predicted MFS family arabinose efflux permease
MLQLSAAEMENLVLAWFVLSDTGSPLQVGLIGAARFGGTLVSPLYGAIVDRFNRRAVLIFARGVSTALAGVLMTLVLTDSFQLWHAYAIVGVSSLARTLGIVANNALSADTVPAGRLASAMGLNRATLDASRIVGSLLGGGLMSSLGLGSAYVAVTALYLAATVVVFGVSARPESARRAGPQVKTPYISQIVQGVKYVRSNSLIPGMLFFAFLIEFTTFPIVNELMAVIGDDLFGVDANGVAALRSVASGGALIGALLTGAFTGMRRPSRVLLVSVVTWHLLTLPVAATSQFGVALAVFFFWGVCGGAAFVALMVGLLQSSRSDFRGRVLGLQVFAVFGLPLGLVMGGWLAGQFGVREMLWIHGLLGLALTAAAVAKWPALWSAQPEPRHEGAAQ